MAPRKLQYFFTKIMGPYHFFDGSGPIFFCSVNAPSVFYDCHSSYRSLLPHSEFSFAFRCFPRLSQRQDKVNFTMIKFTISLCFFYLLGWHFYQNLVHIYRFSAADSLFAVAGMFIFYPAKHYFPNLAH